MGFHQNGCVMKMFKIQGSKEILMEMDEGSLRSLEKYFLWEEMVRWRRKSKGKERVNSDNWGREVEKDETKKEKRETKESGGPKFGPLQFKLSQPKNNNNKKFLKFFKYLLELQILEIFISK